MGANSTMFSVIDGVLLRPLPFPRPEQLVNERQDISKAWACVFCEGVGLLIAMGLTYPKWWW